MAEDWFHIPLQLTFGRSPLSQEFAEMEHMMEDVIDHSFPQSRYLLTHPASGHRALKKMTQEPSAKIQIAALNVCHYKPEEITVKSEGGRVQVRGEHFSESDLGFEKGTFERNYAIPEGVDPKTITYQILPHGVLVIEAANPAAAPPQEEQAVKPRGTYGGELVENDKKFQIALNVSEYEPAEITVTVKGNELTIQGKHQSEEEGHLKSSQFIRHFILPPEVDLSTLKSSYSQGGLCIEAEKTAALPANEPRQLMIENKDE